MDTLSRISNKEILDSQESSAFFDALAQRMSILNSLKVALCENGKFPVMDWEGSEISLAWISKRVRSTFVIDISDDSSYFISYGPGGKLADIEFKSLSSLEEEGLKILSGD